MQREDLGRLARFEEAKIINTDLEKIYKVLEKELKEEQKPDSIIGRFVVDGFGLIVLYVLLFVVCDLTRSMLTDGPFFGLKWLFFGPYYFFTKAPLMTRIWKSKKFLEELADFKDTQTDWPNERSCTSIGNSYTTGCNAEETTHNHPVRDHLGHGLDWILSHFLSGKVGKFINNSTCEQQGSTIAHMCAGDRLTAAYDCYTFFCGVHDVSHTFSKNGPNEGGSFDSQTRGYDFQTQEAYRRYYEVYTAIYDIGSTFTGHPDATPVNLNPNFDTLNQYCYNAASLFELGVFPTPPWFTSANGVQQGPCFYQQNYSVHRLDYWDTSS